MTINSKMTQQALNSIEKITGAPLTLGKLLYAIREAEGLTQVQFGRKLGISKQQLCDIERDRKSVSPKLAAYYAEKLGYSKEQFLRLSLQGVVDRDGLDVIVEVKPRRKSTHLIGLSL